MGNAMAWPKKGTRKITVDGVNLLWHYSGHCPLCSDDVLTVGIPGKPYVLYIDPFPWNFDLTPSSVANAVRWAMINGWTPDNGPTKAMTLDTEKKAFKWLPEGRRHNICKNKP
jgi:hypothetical protein